MQSQAKQKVDLNSLLVAEYRKFASVLSGLSQVRKKN